MKRKLHFKSLVLLLLMPFCSVLFAQNNVDGSSTSVSSKVIESKWNNLLDKTTNYQDYKVVKKDILEDFKNTLSNFVVSSNQNLSNLKSVIETKDSQIEKLSNQLASVKNKNEELNKAVTSISFLGFQMNEGTYNFFVWSLVFLLVLMTAYFLFRYNRANEITKNSKEILANVEDDYEMFKRSAIEREQKLRRQLHDEMKKVNRLREAS